MFCGCSNFIYLNFSHFNTKNVNNKNNMFFSYANLTNLDLSNFNTQKVKDIKFMFCDYYKLSYLDLFNFNSQNVKDMTQMFYNCSNLKLPNIICYDKNIFEETKNKMKNRIIFLQFLLINILSIPLKFLYLSRFIILNDEHPKNIMDILEELLVLNFLDLIL